MDMRPLVTFFDAFSSAPEFDTALSRESLSAVASRELPDVFRVFVPQRVVAFGRQDTHAPRFTDAVAACRPLGFTPVVRLAGGRAAVFHEQTLGFAWQIRTAEPKLDVIARFEVMAGILVGALRSLGHDAIIAEMPGEYCPGRYSIHIGGRKVIGIGQRLIAGAAHVGGVIVINDASAINDVLVPIYSALDLDWDPTRTGSIEGDYSPTSLAIVRDAIIAAVDSRTETVETAWPATLLERAARRIPDHRLLSH